MSPRARPRSTAPFGRLLSTKLTRPAPRPGRLSRRRLTELLDAGLERPLILVAAPAGFGKTTLVADWLETPASRKPNVAWLALDEGDNDPARFWIYVVGALEAAQPGLATSAEALLRVPEVTVLDDVVEELARDLSQVTEPLVLVLDDYHLIETPAIHAALTFLLERLPTSVHLLLTTRSDPPLPLSRMRARAQVTEVRAADLRFTQAETAAFLTEVMGLQLSQQQVGILEARTEGWVAGLQLAGLSLRTRDDEADRAAFVEAFGGSHRLIVDYLVDEVLLRQPEPIGTFLLRTSILERLSGSLCEAVTGQADSQQLLEAIERANLFLVALDDERRWYRYHPLFAEVLRHRLSRQSPELVALLYQRSSAWHEANGYGRLAVEHALAAHDWAAAARLIDTHIWALHARGERETVRRWLLEIPDDARRQFPLLELSLGHAWLSAGEFERAAEVVREVQRRTERSSQPFARALLLEANLAVQRGDPGRALACAERARTLLPEDDRRSHASAAVLLESAYLARGELRAAERVFADAPVALDQPVVGWLLRSDRGVLDALRGRLRDAAQRHRDLLRELGDLPVVYAVEQRWRLGLLHLEWDELDAAEDYLDDALARVDRAHAHVFLARIHLCRAQLLRARGELAAAESAVDLAEQAAERVGNRLHVGWALAERARLKLLRADLVAGEAWAATVRGAPDLATIERESEALVLARVEIARAQPDAALTALSRVLERADTTGCEATAIRALVVRALAFAAGANPERGAASLADALRRAVPGGFRRVFLDEGAALVPLLHSARRASPAVVSSLLAVLDRPAKRSAISAREQEVLELVAEGLSNREIAERLVVAPNTVKAHVRHLGTKLGASSRTQLLARARQSELLS